MLFELVRQDPVCRRLMTAPGVGAVVIGALEPNAPLSRQEWTRPIADRLKIHGLGYRIYSPRFDVLRRKSLIMRSSRSSASKADFFQRLSPTEKPVRNPATKTMTSRPASMTRALTRCHWVHKRQGGRQRLARAATPNPATDA